MSMVQLEQAMMRPVIELEMGLLTMMVVVEALSCALSPGEQPGKPPVGVHSAAVSVHVAVAGGALAVAYGVGIHTASAVATTRTLSASVIAAAMTATRRQRRLGVAAAGWSDVATDSLGMVG